MGVRRETIKRVVFLGLHGLLKWEQTMKHMHTHYEAYAYRL